MMLRWRKNFVPLVIGTALIIACLASASYYRSSYMAAKTAHEGLAEMERLLEEIDRIRRAPRIASLEVESPDRIAAKVSFAANNAELPALCIQSVEPQLPVRLDQSDYQLRATAIVLQNASLAQIAKFAIGLEDRDSGSVVRDLTLRRSTITSAQEHWDARLTLTQMIFSPISAR
jgi:hypothetical protein